MSTQNSFLFLLDGDDMCGIVKIRASECERAKGGGVRGLQCLWFAAESDQTSSDTPVPPGVTEIGEREREREREGGIREKKKERIEEVDSHKGGCFV